MDELMDYECLVPNVSGVFVALTSEQGQNLLNQSEVREFLPTPAVRLPAAPITANFRLAPALLSLAARLIGMGFTVLELLAAQERKLSFLSNLRKCLTHDQWKYLLLPE